MALLDQLLETYVESFKQGRDVPHKETREIIASFKNQIICEVKEILTCEEKSRCE